ncbi:MAG TPA: glycerate kinase [Candidatus Limnocylindrales bacterium]|nr:glycerate kinase [Candidatus Limnocylindrales bacterium]
MSRVLAAPDAFKGSLSSVEVAAALARGWSAGRPTDIVRLAPLSDGGEGLLAAVAAAGGWQELPASTRDPLGRPIVAHFLRDDAGEGRAVIELAEASGLSRVLRPVAEGGDERDPLAASTLGTGLILAAAIGLGCRHIVLGIGGSATTDGGAGLLTALGVRLLDAAGQDLAPGGANLAGLATVDLSGLAPLLGEVDLTVASDVTNPLLGELGAAATYGPQKGATSDQVAELDATLGHYADVLENAVGRPLRDQPGAGAAGGTGFGLLALADRFRSFAVQPGVEVVMELAGFEAALVEADIVLTGEGRVDEQTAFGKTCWGVALRAAAAARPCLCFAGAVVPEGEAALRGIGAACLPVVEWPVSLDEAMAAGPEPVARAAERAARLVSIDLAGR